MYESSYSGHKLLNRQRAFFSWDSQALSQSKQSLTQSPPKRTLCRKAGSVETLSGPIHPEGSLYRTSVEPER